MKNTIKLALEDALKTLQMEIPSNIDIETPKEESHGDLATPLALIIAKTLRKKPRDLAMAIVGAIADRSPFEKIEIAGPGFINFTFKLSFLVKEIKRLLVEKDAFLRPDVGKGLKIQIEFVSANPTGPMHLGHGRGAAFGNALANLLEAGGYKVTREYYVNDAGRQTVVLAHSVFARYKELLGVEYPFPEDGYKGEYVIEIAEAIKADLGERHKDSSFETAKADFTDFSLQMALGWIKTDLDLFGVKFDTWQSEKALFADGDVQRALDFLKQSGRVYESESALWFKATDFGDEKDRVVKKSDGEYTYFASDIAYHKKKIDAGFDEIINIWGADHHGYIPRLEAVIDALGYERKKLRVILIQMVSLLRGGAVVPMSKRAGDFVTLKEIIEEVGADTAKFIFMTRRPDSQLEFDLETAKAQSSENPVFYVQYANARINSIFKKAEAKGISLSDFDKVEFTHHRTEYEIKLIKKLLRYPMVFETAVLAHEPHRITFYLQETASLYHRYYHETHVLSGNVEEDRERLALCEAVRIVLRDGLQILGVTAPERM